MRASLWLLCALWPVTASPVFAEPEHARWPIKTSVPRPMGAGTPVSFADLAALPLPPHTHKTSADGDRTYQAKLYPAFPNKAGVREGQLIRVKAYLHLVAQEADGDYHIQISDSPTNGDRCIVVEVPDEQEGTPALQQRFTAVRAFVREKLLAGKEPGTRGNVMRRPPYVEVTGQLFLDDWHIKGPARGKKGMHCYTLWEVHPITNMKFAVKSTTHR